MDSRPAPKHPAPAADPVEAVKAAATQQIEAKPTRRWRARVFQVYLVSATAAFAILVVLASRFNYFSVDLTVTRGLQSIDWIGFSTLMIWVSYIGYFPQMLIVIALAAVLLFLIGLRWEALGMLIAALGSGSLGQLIKALVHRPRPGADLVNVIDPLNSFSFPSGHVLTYTAFFGFLFFLAYTLLKPSLIRAVLLFFSGSFIVLVSLSRIYVGAHWASDTVGAYLLGSLWLIVSIYIYAWGKTRFFVRQPLAPETPDPLKTKL